MKMHFKKLIAVLLIITIVASAFVIPASAQSIGTTIIGGAIGAVMFTVFSPFMLIDLLLYPIFGFHVLYPQWN